MAFDLEDLNQEELEQFKSHRKIKIFVAGIEAMLVALTLHIATLDVAEQLDCQYQMDFEVILSESRQLKQKLLGLKDQIDNLLGNGSTETSELLCNTLDPVQDGVMMDGTDQEDSETFVTFETLMQVTERQDGCESVHCYHCCQRLALGA